MASFQCRLLSSLVTLAGACLLLLTASLASADDGDKVRLALNWKPEAEFGGFYAAERRGAFAAQKLKVDILPGGVGTPVVQMVAAGTVAFGIAGADEIVISRDRGSDVVALFAVHQTNAQGILVRSERKLATIGDVFKSGSVALQKGLPYYLFLEKKFGPFRAKVVPFLGGISQITKDAQMAQQGYITSEPILARQQGLDTHFFLNADAGYNPYGTVLITRLAYVKSHPHVVAKMLAATRSGWADYLEEPKPTNEVLHKLNPTMSLATLDASSAVQKSLVETAETQKFGLGSMQASRWEELAGQLVALKLIGKALPADSYFYQPPTAAKAP